MSIYWYAENMGSVEVVPATDEGVAASKTWGFGDFFYELSPEHLAALQQGQALKLELGSEYLAFVRLRPSNG